MDNDLLDIFLNGNNSRNSNTTILDEPEIRDYHFERNLSFTLPFNFSKHSSKSKYEKKLEISTVDKNNIITRQVEITSEHGPLNGVDQDVLICLMSLAKSQKTEMPRFTLLNICNILEMPSSSTKMVKESIRKMSDVKLVFKDTFVGPDGKIQKEYITRLINNAEFNDVLRKNAPKSEHHHVSFDKKVIDNIMRDFTITIPREFYNRLPYGGPKSLIRLLEANRINTNQPVFLMKIEDLASIIGINSEPRFIKRKLKEYLCALQENNVKLEFSFHGKAPIMLRVSYDGLESESSLEKECREIFERLQTRFSDVYLEKYNVKKYLSYWSMKFHKDNDYIYMGKHNYGFKKIYLVVEQLLKQYEDGQPIKNFHALIEKTYDNIILDHSESCFLFTKNELLKSDSYSSQKVSITIDKKMLDTFQDENPEEYLKIKELAEQEFDELFSDFEGFSFNTYLETKVSAAVKENLERTISE